jgi:hypothetical protein
LQMDRKASEADMIQDDKGKGTGSPTEMGIEEFLARCGRDSLDEAFGQIAEIAVEKTPRAFRRVLKDPKKFDLVVARLAAAHIGQLICEAKGIDLQATDGDWVNAVREWRERTNYVVNV